MEQNCSNHRRRPDRPRLGDGVRARGLARAAVRHATGAARCGARAHRGEPRRAAGGRAGRRSPRRRCARIARAPRIEDALAGVDWVQENLPETLDVKREVFARWTRCAPARCLLASSTSAIPRRSSPRRSRAARAASSRIRSIRRISCRSSSCAARRGPAPRRIERAQRGDDATSARCRSSCAARSTASSSTACRARCWPRRCAWSAKATCRREDLDKTIARRPGPALVVHGAVRDHRAERAGRRCRLLRALRRLLSHGSPPTPPPPAVWDSD